MENNLYECESEMLYSRMPQEEKWPALLKHEENIENLHAYRLQTMLFDTDEERMGSEEPTRFYVFKIQKIRTANTIHNVPYTPGHIHETPQCVIQTFARYFNVKPTPIDVDVIAIEEMAKTIRTFWPNTYAKLAEQQIRSKEIRVALQKGGQQLHPSGI